MFLKILRTLGSAFILCVLTLTALNIYSGHVSAVTPTISNLAPADGATVSGPFTVSARASVPSTDTLNASTAVFTVDGITYLPTSVVWDGHWESDGCSSRWVRDYNGASFSASVPELGAGPHAITFRIADASGDYATASWSVWHPAIIYFSGQTPPNGSLLTEVAYIQVNLSSPNPIKSSTISLKLDGSPISFTVTQSPDLKTAVVYSEAYVPDGNHTIQVSASDYLGSPSVSSSWSLTVDSMAPTIGALSPESGAIVADSLTPLSATINNASAINLNSLKLFLDGIELTAAQKSLTSISSAQITWAGPLPEGEHTAKVEGRDIAGNYASKTWSFTVRDAPRFGTPSPLPDSTLERVFNIGILVEDKNDALDPSSLAITFDGAPIQGSLTTTNGRSGSIYAPVTATAGNHTATVRISDMAGNVTAKTWSFTVYSSGPVLDLSTRTPASGSTLTTPNVTFSATLTDPAQINLSTIRVWVDGSPVTISAYYGGHWESDGCDSWWVEDPTIGVFSGSSALRDGQHTISVEATNGSGVKSPRYSWSFTVAEPPSITSIQPTAGSQSYSNTVTASAYIRDFEGLSANSISLSYRVSNAGQSPGPWQNVPFSYNPTTGFLQGYFVAPMKDAHYEIRLQATDGGGLQTTAMTDVLIMSSGATMTLPSVWTCLNCHPTIYSTHPMNNCAACHGMTLDCSQCHGSHTLQDAMTLGNKQCSDCHSQHGDYSLILQQHATTSALSCGQCHKRSLITEHAGLTVNGQAFVCETCHNSADPRVQRAISLHATGCEACHPGAHPAGPASADCKSCHMLGGVAPKAIDFKAFAASAHGSLNGATSEDPNRACWACHGVGSASEHPSTYKNPKLCQDCHTGRGEYSAKLVEAHRYGAPVSVNYTLSSTKPVTGSCLYCHSQAKGSIKSNIDPDKGNFDPSGSGITGGRASASHYVVKPAIDASGSDLCKYCHMNPTNGAFWGAKQYSDIKAHTTYYQRNKSLGKGRFSTLSSFRILGNGSSETSTSPYDGSTIWLYKDNYDSSFKQEGGYRPVETMTECSECHGISGGFHDPITSWVPGPHGGYDTGTNKCKTCHAVHRAGGAYYLLRADSQDDACSYCHIGGSAHSAKVVYTLNPAGIYTTNGHTMGAQSLIPDSSVDQDLEVVTLYTTDENGNTVSEDIRVRRYDNKKNKMFRFARHHGQSAAGTGRSGYMRIGPLALRCMNCHQPHNAQELIWKPADFYNPSTKTGYKLLRKSPSGSIFGGVSGDGRYDNGMVNWTEFDDYDTTGFVNSSNIITVPEETMTAANTGKDASSGSTDPSFPNTIYTAYVGVTDPAHQHGPDRDPQTINQFALSAWCADCHNLNIGYFKYLDKPELGSRAHSDRTHPSPYIGAYNGPGQCYSCHRNDLPQSPVESFYNSSYASCEECHFGTGSYASALSAAPDSGYDFPHSGQSSTVKLLGPVTAYLDGNGQRQTTTTIPITEGNLDGICLRCHTGIGANH